MKQAYPVTLTPTESGYLVYVPDFDINTQGKDIADAIYMTRDAISLIGIDMEDDGEHLPVPCDVSAVKVGDNEIVTLVDVDFDAYRRLQNTKAVRKTVSIPAWMDEMAAENNIRLSRVLQDALRTQLGI